MEKGKRMFTIEGNLCGERVRLGRALHKPPLTQEQLAAKLQLEGLDMTKVMISKIESGVRHVCDAELRALARVLGVSMEWLVGDEDVMKSIFKK